MKRQAGESLLGVPVQPQTLDNIDRAPSLLHHRITLTGLCIAVTMSTASLAIKKPPNETLRKYGQGWRFAETSKKRDQRPKGNDSRALLTGLLSELLTLKVYDEARDDESAAAMDKINRTAQESNNIQGIHAAAPPCTLARASSWVVKKKKKREPISLGGFTTATNTRTPGSLGGAGLLDRQALPATPSVAAAGPSFAGPPVPGRTRAVPNA
eukprot:5407941-Pleurochrysis_carterae.AAC.1